MVVVLVASACCASASTTTPQHQIVSTADNALPMSLSTVVSDLEAEGCTDLSTACFITSRTVTQQERRRLLGQLLSDCGDISHNEQAGTAEQWKAVATTAGIALAQPSVSSTETAAAACACGGTILYYASPTDLARGEGLLDALAPAMEKILSSTDHKQRHLYILVENSKDKKKVRQQLEQAAEAALAHLVVTPSNNGSAAAVRTLQDVFDHVDCIAPSQAVAAVIRTERTTPAAVAAQVALLWNPQEQLTSQMLQASMALTDSSANLAAARTLGPAARRRVRDTLQQIQQTCSDATGNPKLVPNFGAIADAALEQAAEQLQSDFRQSSPLLHNSATAKQIKANLVADLDGALQDIVAQQLELLQEAEFQAFKRSLSKLLVSPRLQADMEAAAQQSVASFTKAAQKLVPKRSSSSKAAAATSYARRLSEHVAQRILNSRASGKYKPVPRRGVTVGLHWLLPKPFGNDYRQEPWMVHAVDDMVYVPPGRNGKLSDVAAEDVAAGDWRDKIVPSPPGNDMVYMQ